VNLSQLDMSSIALLEESLKYAQDMGLTETDDLTPESRAGWPDPNQVVLSMKPKVQGSKPLRERVFEDTMGTDLAALLGEIEPQRNVQER
jgi:hypothetical protein